MKSFFERLTVRTQQFMQGRHGADQLTLFLLALTLTFSLIGSLTLGWLLKPLSLALFIVAYYRILSKKLYKRQQENFVFLRYWYPVRDRAKKYAARLQGMRTHKYFKCPQCKQTLRVPRGKGAITVTCPKCKHEMHTKS